MDSVYFVCAIISFVLFMDGMLLKNDRFKTIIVKNIKKEDAKARVELISRFMIVTSILAFTWTVMGYALNDLLRIELFMLIYFSLVGIVGLSLFFKFKTRFR